MQPVAKISPKRWHFRFILSLSNVFVMGQNFFNHFSSSFSVSSTKEYNGTWQVSAFDYQWGNKARDDDQMTCARTGYTEGPWWVMDMYDNYTISGVTIIGGSWSSVHDGDVIMDEKASQITSLTIVYSTVYSDADQTKHQSSASLDFVRGIHRGPVHSPHKWPVTRKIFPFHDVIMNNYTGVGMGWGHH